MPYPSTVLLSVNHHLYADDTQTFLLFYLVSPIFRMLFNSDSELSTLETDIYIWRYALLVVHAIKEEEEEDADV